MTLGIAFEGCAGRAAFSAGVAMRLEELGLMPHRIAGASSGAIVAAFVASGQAAELGPAWLSAAGQPVFLAREMSRFRWPFRMSRLVGDAVRTALGDTRIDQLARPVAIPVTLIGSSGLSRRVLTRNDAVPVVDAVLASCFIPGPYSRLIRVDGRPAFDGAWQFRIPLRDLAGLGATRMIAVLGHPRRTIAQGFPFVRHAPITGDCRIIAPSAPLALGAYDTDPERITSAIETGRRAAEIFARDHNDWIRHGS